MSVDDAGALHGQAADLVLSHGVREETTARDVAGGGGAGARAGGCRQVRQEVLLQEGGPHPEPQPRSRPRHL